MAREILIIDDSPDLREMLRTFLEMEGFSVILAKNGVEGLAQLRSGKKPCLILVDMRMDVMSGPEFIQRARAEYIQAREAPIVAMSAAEMEPTEGVSEYLMKPFDIDKLTKTVNAHCG